MKMKSLYRFFCLFMLLTLLLSACGPTPTPVPTNPPAPTSAPTAAPTVAPTAAPTAAATATAAPDPNALYLNITWHQHQPLYYKNSDGVITRPWVRVHATKDYYDMAAMVAKYPSVHVTFNLTPVLIRQLDDYINGAKDLYQVLAEK